MTIALLTPPQAQAGPLLPFGAEGGPQLPPGAVGSVIDIGVGATILAGAGLALLAAPAAGALAVGGVAAGSLLAVGSFALALRELQEWGLINWRPQPVTRGLEEGDVYRTGSTVNVGISVRFNTTVVRSNITSCDTGINFGSITNNQGDNNTPFFSGVAVRIGRITQNRTAICGSGPGFEGFSAPRFTVIKANGEEEVIQSTNTGEVIPNSNQSWSQVTTFRPVSFNVGGEIREADVTEPGTFAPNTRPRLFPPTLPDAPVLPPPPGTLPPVPQLPPPPERERPLAPPVPIQRPGQRPATPAGPRPRTPAAPAITPTPTPRRPPAVPLLPGGPATEPEDPTVTRTPPGVVIVGGVPVGGPGQAPAATMAGLAREVGRIEAKAELAISIENGNQAQGQELASLLEQIQRTLQEVADELLSTDPGGAFTLAPGCPARPGGDPAPTVEVPVLGAPTRLRGIGERINGLAGLIQQHKLMGQPTCGGRGSGPSSNVTVHFESP